MRFIEDKTADVTTFISSDGRARIQTHHKLVDHWSVYMYEDDQWFYVSAFPTMKEAHDQALCFVD